MAKRLILVLLTQSLFILTAAHSSPLTKPNILLIITDDQRFDDLDGVMPKTKESIFDQGVRFTRGYVTTPACNPSRASIFTGLYTSHHGAYTNRFPLESDTFVSRLKNEGGYHTGLVGKFMNTWDGSPRPEFDYWVSFAGGSSKYENPILNIQGEWKTQEGYMTTLLEKYAIQFLEQAQQEKKPWFLALPFNAPHLPLTLPKEKDRKHKSISEIPIRKNDNVIPTGAPTWLKEKKPFSPKMRKRLLEQRLEQREALSILDESIERIIANLKQGGSYENTLIFFLSDNGLFFGEHRLQSKDAIYEEATKVPFAIRKPGQAQGTLNQALVANIDIAPTIFDYAEVPKPWHMDGISLKPLLEQNEEIQPRMLLVEGFRRAGPRNAFSALHTGGEVFVTQHYIATEPNEYELYDLDEDEFQLTNRVEDLKKKDSVSTLKHNLLETIKEMRGSLIVELPKEKRLPAKISGPKRKDLKRSPQL